MIQQPSHRFLIHKLLAYWRSLLVDNPIAVTKTDFDEYDRRVSEAADRLQQSNEILARDYRTIGDVQEISPL